MSIFKKIVLSLAACSLLLNGCGKISDGDSKLPDGVVNVEVTTSESTDETPNETDGNVNFIQTEAPALTSSAYIYTTTSKKHFYVFDDNDGKTTAATTSRKLVTTHTTSAAPVHIQTSAAPVLTLPAAEIIPTSANTEIVQTTVSTVTAAAVPTTSQTTEQKTTSAAKTTAAAIITTTVTTTALPDTDENTIDEIIGNMTLRQKVCQMFIVAPEQLVGDAYTVTDFDYQMRYYLVDNPVGGVIHFAKNLESPKQIVSLNNALQRFSKWSCGLGMFIGVDEEGGAVARVAHKLGTTPLESMSYYGSFQNEEMAYNIGSTIGQDISQFGFNLDFAPVADVDINTYNELGNRIFSDNPLVVSRMTAAVVKGLQDNDVSATLKHFPGLGAAGGNTHYDNKVYIDRTLEELRENEFVAFSGGIEAGSDFVMVGHQIIKELDEDMPSDMSYKTVTELLREELGFNGIAVTDSQRMNTISDVYTSGEAAVNSILAGIDMILMPADLDEAVEAVITAVEEGVISEDRIDESLARILAVKEAHGLLYDRSE